MRGRAAAGAWAASSLLALAAVLALPAALAGAAALPAPVKAAAVPAGCKPATNVEVIVDDSLSMQVSDPNRLRVQGLDLLLETLPAKTWLGAIEFGYGYGGLRPPASQLFAPAPIGPNAARMKGALSASIRADDGLTDFNGAFALADSENPTAQARIFLTDGGHDEGEYGGGHLAHAVPTYVVGLGAGLSQEDEARLRRIAGETGGRYYPPSRSGQPQAALNGVAALLSCQLPPWTFVDRLAPGRAATRAIPVGAGAGSARIVLTWASPADRFKLGGLRLVQPGNGPKPRTLRIERRGSTTYSVIEVSGLGKGRLRFSVAAARIGSGEPQPPLTTQVSLEKGK